MSTLREEILSVRSKREASVLVKKFMNHQYEVSELMDLFFSDDWVTCQKASWPITLLADKRPDWFYPYIESMLINLDRPHHDAVVRNTVRTWEAMNPLPPEWQGPIYDKSFAYFSDPQYAAAIRVFSMTVCSNIAMAHPALAEEIIPIIEDHWDHATAAWRSRGRKELKRLRKLI